MGSKLVGRFADIGHPSGAIHYRLVRSERTGELLLYTEPPGDPEPLEVRQMQLRVLEELIGQALLQQADLTSAKPDESKTKRTLSYDHLRAALWPGKEPGPDVLYKHVSELRKCLQDTPKNSRLIATIGSGKKSAYMLLPDVQSEPTPNETVVSTAANTEADPPRVSDTQPSSASLLSKYLAHLIRHLDSEAIPRYFPSHLSAEGGIGRIRQPIRVRVPDKNADRSEPGKPNSANSGSDISGARRSGELDWEDTGKEENRHRFCLTVVLGDPGSGKTWLLRYEAMRLANQALERLASGQSPDTIGDVPVLAHLSEVNTFIAPNSPDLAGAIVKCLPRTFRRLFTELIASNRVVLLLDAWDEAATGSPFDQDGRDLRRGLEQALKSFAETHSCRLVLSSRRSEYSWSPIPAATEVVLKPFAESEVVAFTESWFHDAPDRLKRLQSLLLQDPHVRRMAGNPFLLSLICWTFNDLKSDIPKDRAALYERVLAKFLDWPETDRKRRVEPLQTPGLLARLSKAAWALAPETRFDDITFAEKLGYRLVDRYEEKEAIDCRDQLLNSGVLTRQGGNQLSFIHYTIQEYLAAYYITKNRLSDPQWRPDHLHDPRWRGIWLFVASLAHSVDAIVRLQSAAATVIDNELKLQEYLAWCHQKAVTAGGGYTPAVRAFYYSLGLFRDDCVVDDGFGHLQRDSLSGMLHECLLDLPGTTRDRILSHLGEAHPEYCSVYDLDRLLTESTVLDRSLNKTLSTIDSLAPNDSLAFYDASHCHSETLRILRNSGEACALAFTTLGSPKIIAQEMRPWRKRFRALAIRYRDIGRRWTFSDEETARLERYYSANKVIVECLGAAENLDPEEKQRILEGFLLPRQPVQLVHASLLANNEEEWARSEEYALKGERLMAEGSLAEALAAYDIALPGLRQLAEQHAKFLQLYVQTVRKRADVLQNIGPHRLADAVDAYAEMIAACGASEQLQSNPEITHQCALAHRNLGIALQHLDNLTDAIDSYATAQDHFDHLSPEMMTPEVKEELALTLRNRGILLHRVASISESVAALTEAANLYEQIVKVEEWIEPRINLADTYLQLVFALAREAEAELTDILDAARKSREWWAILSSQGVNASAGLKTAQRLERHFAQLVDS